MGGYQLQRDVRFLEGLLPPPNTSASKGAPTKPEAVEEMDVGSPRPTPSSLAVRGEVPMLTDESSQDTQSTSTSKPSSRGSASRSGTSEEGGSLAEQQDTAGEFGPQSTASQKRQLKKKQKALQAGPAETSVKPRQMSEELLKFFKSLPDEPTGKNFRMTQKILHDKRDCLIELDSLPKTSERVAETNQLKRSLENQTKSTRGISNTKSSSAQSSRPQPSERKGTQRTTPYPKPRPQNPQQGGYQPRPPLGYLPYPEPYHREREFPVLPSVPNPQGPRFSAPGSYAAVSSPVP